MYLKKVMLINGKANVKNKNLHLSKNTGISTIIKRLEQNQKRLLSTRELFKMHHL